MSVMLRIAELILDVVMPDQINEILRNHVKEKLGRGEVVASMTVRLVRGVEIARIAKTAGFDSLSIWSIQASRWRPPGRSASPRWK
jgi:hypothetical protein